MALPLSLVSEVYVENVGGVEVRLCGENWKFFGAENEKEVRKYILEHFAKMYICRSGESIRR